MPRYWRERILEKEKARLNRLERKHLFRELLPNKEDEIYSDVTRRALQRLGISLGPTALRRIRRLRRKVKRMEKGTFRRRNTGNYEERAA